MNESRVPLITTRPTSLNGNTFSSCSPGKLHLLIVNGFYKVLQNHGPWGASDARGLTPWSSPQRRRPPDVPKSNSKVKCHLNLTRHHMYISRMASRAGWAGEKAMPNERRERNVRGEEETKCSRSRCSEGKRAVGSEDAAPNRTASFELISELHAQPPNTTRVTVT